MRHAVAAILIALLSATPAAAQEKIKIVASFSILADVVSNIGGDHVEVISLVGPDSDAHVYSPTPSDAKKLAEAEVVFVNGLGFEGWLGRLVQASGTKATTVIVSTGVRPRSRSGAGRIDPHAWQSVANMKLYVANIRNGLIAGDPASKAAYELNAAAYLARLDALDREVRDTITKIPAGRRRLIVPHDAFGYFTDTYGVAMFAPEGVSTESEPSARDVASMILQIRNQKISGIFLENVIDPRLMQQIARETGARLGGTLYSDALSQAGGPADSYITMMRNNVRVLGAALVP